MKSYYPEETEHTYFETGEDGMFLLPEKLKPGTYYFREIEAPYGYLLGEDVAFEIREGHNWAEPVTVEFYDEPLMGKLEIIKTDADTGDVLEGAEFEVIAEKDIITGDGTIQIKAGETAAVLKTDEKGKAESGLLCQGTYRVREIQAPEGYIRAEKEWIVELTKDAEDDEQKEFVRKMRITNQKEKIIVEKEKKKSKPQSVKTGDPSQMKKWMMIVSAESVVLILMLLTLTRKRKKGYKKSV